MCVSWFTVSLHDCQQGPHLAISCSVHFREIQQILVKLGDKARDFIGSQNWIGAIELSYILDDYLGVTSKIITVNSMGQTVLANYDGNSLYDYDQSKRLQSKFHRRIRIQEKACLSDKGLSAGKGVPSYRRQLAMMAS
eukprot:scaffold71373_cov17-Tisochrysis_lutea.AAC.1